MKKLGEHLTRGAGMCALPGTAGPIELIERAHARESATARATAILGRTRAEGLTAKARTSGVDPVAAIELGALSHSIGVAMTDDELVDMARGGVGEYIGFPKQPMGGKTTTMWVIDDIVSEVKPKPTRTLSSSTWGWLVAALGPGNGRAPV